MKLLCHFLEFSQKVKHPRIGGEGGTGDGRRETGDGGREWEVGRRETGDGRREWKDGRRESGDYR
ncbi:MAG: hypothetical protein Q7J63_07000 [Rhodonellum sp.]|nr:hypothetical protein [Rhodonellum sp.]